MRHRLHRKSLTGPMLLPPAALLIAALALALWLPMQMGGAAAEPSPGLSVSKTCSDSYGLPATAVDQWVIYDYAVTNTSAETLYRESIVDDREGDLTSSFPATLAPGETAPTVREFHYVAESDPRPLVNQVTAIYKTSDGTQIHATDACKMDVLHLTVVKEASLADGLFTFQFTLTNDGSLPLTRIDVSDSTLGNVTTSFPENLAVGETKVVTITLPWYPGARLCNWAEVTYAYSAPGWQMVVHGRAEACVEEEEPPTIATESSETGTVAPGTSVTDTATLSGPSGEPTPTGQVSFFLCQPDEVTPGGCEGSAGSQIGNPKTLVDGSATSDPTTNTTATGKYCWRTEYSGDEIYLPATHTNSTTECFTTVAEEPGKLILEKHKRMKKCCRRFKEFPWPWGPSWAYPDVSFRVCQGVVSDAECGSTVPLFTTLIVTGPDPVSVDLPAGTYTVCEDEPDAPFSRTVDVVLGGPCKTVDIQPGETETLLFVNCHPSQAYLCAR
jgi:hypothetical protein